jgi:hypothetical protein
MVEYTAKHGRNGLIYISGVELYGANSWTLNISTESAEYAAFGESWKTRLTGLNDWGGSVTAWHDQDGKKLVDAAVAGAVVALAIYPDRGDLTTYASGNAIFSVDRSADMGSIISQTANFVGSGSPTHTGWS